MGNRLPPLAALAATFAAIDLFVVRIALRGTTGRGVWDALSDYASVPITVAAIAACVTLTASLVAILRMPPPPAFSHRLSLALFTGIFVPVVAAAAFMPRTVIVRDSNFLVHLATFSAGLLVVLFSGVAIPRPGPATLRVGALLLSVTSLAHVLHLSTTSMGLLGQIPVVAQIGALAEVVGFAAYCLLPVVLCVTLLKRALVNGKWGPIGTAVGVSLVLAGLLIWQVQAEHRLERSLTAALGFHQLASLWRFAPAVVLSFFVAVSVGKLVGGQRQAGLALLLVLCAGFAPTAPGYLVMWVLGTVLLMRASISLYYTPFASLRATPNSAERSEHDANDASGHASSQHSTEHGAQA